MWLEDWYEDIDTSEWWWEKSQETAKEAQEKKEKATKAMAWIKKTRKDEKKAHKDNDFLFQIVFDIIQNKSYDVILPFIAGLLKANIPSNLIIWGISLIYSEAVYIIRTNYKEWNNSLIIDKKKASEYQITINYKLTESVIEFNDSNLDEAIKWRINEWIWDIISIISFDPSSIITNKFLSQVHNSENRDIVINYLASVLTFFLFDLNIVISKDKAFQYSEFILSEIIKKLKSLKLEEIE